MEKATTMESPHKAARKEHLHSYPTRYNKRATTNFTDASGSRKRYTAATHLASAIKSDNIFTMMAIEEIAESINALQDNNIDVKDPTSEDYIPPNRKLMLKCTHRPRWEKAEDDELLSFQQCEVMAKYPTLPMGSKALPLKWIYTIKRDLKGNIIRYKARLVAQGFFQVF